MSKDNVGQILVIAPDTRELDSLLRFLNARSYWILIATTGSSGFRRALEVEPALVMIDDRLSDVDPLELCSLMRDDDTLARIPVIMVTSRMSPEKKVHAFRAGADDVVSRPFREAEMEARIVVRMRNARLRAQLERNGEELQRLIEAEREASRMRRRMFAMATHEFRSPLMAAQLAATMIRRYGHDMDAAERNEECDAIIENTTRMNRTLSELLDFLHNDDGNRFDTSRKATDVAEAVGLITAPFTSSENGERFHVCYRGTPGTHLVAAKALNHVLTNLISNAAKYSEAHEPVVIEVECSESDLSLTVKDRGIGIPHAELEDVFEPFARASNVDATGGNGLGLAIVKQLVDEVEGSLGIRSEPGVGTTASVTFPAERVQDRAENPC